MQGLSKAIRRKKLWSILWSSPCTIGSQTSRFRGRNNNYLQVKGKKVKNRLNKIISKDGTKIAYDKQGQGPAVILVDCALSF
jgi:hypothetical protein